MGRAVIAFFNMIWIVLQGALCSSRGDHKTLLFLTLAPRKEVKEQKKRILFFQQRLD